MPATKLHKHDSLFIKNTLDVCEQAFYVVNINKSKLRSRLSQRHLNDIMKIVTAQGSVPDVDRLVKVSQVYQ